MREKLSKIYEHVDDIDVYVGGLSESVIDGGVVGPLFAHMIAKQFNELKFGDRFYFENGGENTVFSPIQLQELRRFTLVKG